MGLNLTPREIFTDMAEYKGVSFETVENWFNSKELLLGDTARTTGHATRLFYIKLPDEELLIKCILDSLESVSGKVKKSKSKTPYIKEKMWLDLFNRFEGYAPKLKYFNSDKKLLYLEVFSGGSLYDNMVRMCKERENLIELFKENGSDEKIKLFIDDLNHDFYQIIDQHIYATIDIILENSIIAENAIKNGLFNPKDYYDNESNLFTILEEEDFREEIEDYHEDIMTYMDPDLYTNEIVRKNIKERMKLKPLVEKNLELNKEISIIRATNANSFEEIKYDYSGGTEYLHSFDLRILPYDCHPLNFLVRKPFSLSCVMDPDYERKTHILKFFGEKQGYLGKEYKPVLIGNTKVSYDDFAVTDFNKYGYATMPFIIGMFFSHYVFNSFPRSKILHYAEYAMRQDLELTKKENSLPIELRLFSVKGKWLYKFFSGYCYGDLRGFNFFKGIHSKRAHPLALANNFPPIHDLDDDYHAFWSYMKKIFLTYDRQNQKLLNKIRILHK